MFEIIITTAKILLILFAMGAGFTALFLPKSLQKDSFWLIPWFGIVLIAILGVMFNLARIPLSECKNVIFLIAGVLFLYSIISGKKVFNLHKESISIAILVAISLLYNLYPLISQVGYPTTISLGNMDPLSYSPVADFLTNHTVFEGKIFEHYKPYLWATGDLLHSGFRWGSPMILSFIASVLGVRAYVVYFILLIVSFVLSFPLVYIIAKRMISKKSAFILPIVFLTFTFNSTILYMVYNVFYAQFLFTGIYMLILLLIYEYLNEHKLNHQFNSYDLLLGVSISSLTSIYPEGIIFVLIPLGITGFFYVIRDRNYVRLVSILKILTVAFIINPYTFGTAIEQNVRIILSSTHSAFIGWEKIPFAAPLEIMGLYNLYFSRDLPTVIDIIIGAPIVGIWLYGLKKLKYPQVMSAYLVTFITFFIVLRFIFPNFFSYHRAITYSLFLFPILFSGGLVWLSARFHKYFKFVILASIFLLVARSAYRTTYQIYWHMRVVDKALISLQELNLANNMPQPFYTADVFFGEYDLWKRLWREYFLMNKLIVTRQNFPTELYFLPETKYVLAEKELLQYKGKKLKYKNVVWENAYYKLGEVEAVSYADDLKKLFPKK